MKKSVEKKEERKEFNLEGAFVLWRNNSKSGKHYLKGFTSEKLGKGGLVGFFNTNKKNPKEPDIRVYEIDSEGNQGKEVASLWEQVSKAENRYLSGMSDEKEKLVGFYTEDTKNDERPYVRVYFRED